MKLNFFVVFVILLASFASASFEKGDELYNITTEYSSGEFIKGWVNLSFSEENFNSTFVTNTGESITLFELLESNNLVSDCDIPDCNIDYITSNSETIKIMDLVEGESKLIGFKFEENIINLNTIDFRIASDVSKSCYNQLKVDVFNDESINVKNTNYSNEHCSLFRTKGCFDEEHSVSEVIISNNPVCQRVELPESGGFRLGADVFVEGSSDKKSLNFGIYDLHGIGLGSCANNDVTGSGEFFCDVNGVNSDSTKEYYICVTGNVGDNVKIHYYQDNNGCGFSGIPPKSENYSYNIIAYSKQFKPINSFSVLDQYSNNLLIDIQNYLETKYGASLECSVKNCVVPMKILPRVTQQVTFDSLVGAVDTFAGTVPISSNFYDLTQTPAKYDSGFYQLSLDNLSLSPGIDSFSLELNGNQIFSQEIIVQSIPLIRSLTPLITAAAVATEFKISIDAIGANNSISNYNWDFGNGDSRNTATNSLTYSYNSTGNFDMVVTIILNGGLNTSKTFKVLVETPINAVNTTLKEKLGYLDQIKSQLNSLPVFHQNSLKSMLNLVVIENQLTKTKISFDSAIEGVADSYYVGLMIDLLGIVIPHSIVTTKSADFLPFYIGEDKIDVNVLSLLDESSVDREKEYNDAILAWNLNNLVNTITYKEISADYGDGLEILLNVFELNVNKADPDETIFLIIKKIDSLKFDKDYDKRELGDYIFIPLKESTSKVVFSTTESMSFSDLPLFISPQINSLKLTEILVEEEGISKWVLFGLIIFLLILISIVAYIILQKWYSKKYESYLFKNKNDLYNLISFIENSKKKGVDEKKIIASLEKSGWKGEQLRYIIRKYLGKRTGMFEIPVEKLLNFFKKKQVVISQASVPKKRPSRRSGFNPNIRKNIRRR
jgi:PKD repeat protein